MKINIRTISALGFVALLAAPVASAELIVNGNFQSGYTGFTSAYTIGQPGNTGLYPAGTYALLTDPSLGHNLFASFGDHTSGTGLMMVINGAAAPVNVWAEGPITVTANTNYLLSAWVTSVYSASPALLSFNLNGSQVGSNFSLAGTTVGDWQHFTGTWNSGANTSASLAAIVDQNLEPNGNDFALDDISLVEQTADVGAVPEPSSWILLGTGIVLFGAFTKVSGGRSYSGLRKQ